MATKFVSFERLTTFKDKIIELLNGKLNKSGGTMTGDLKVGLSSMGTNGYVEGTWFRATANLALSTKPTLWCVLKDNWIYTRTTEQVKSDLNIPDESLDVTVTLGTSWTGSAAPYSQSVTVTGLLATDSPILDIQTSLNNYAVEEENWMNIFKAESSADKLTFYAKEKTTVNLTIKVKVVR